VEEGIRRYRTVRALSRVVNDLLKERICRRKELIELVYSDKVVEVSPEWFEEFRRELSRRFEMR